MINNLHVKTLPLSSVKEISTLVENKRTSFSSNLELHVFETYQQSEKVDLKLGEFVIINMIMGKKIMHLSGVPAFEYLPGETLVLPANTKMQIDFPEAEIDNPTQCTALTVDMNKINAVLDYLNQYYPRTHRSEKWGFDINMFHLANTEELTHLINKLFQIMRSDNPMKDILSDLTFKELIIRLLQNQTLKSLALSPDRNSSALTFIKTYINDHISELITVDHLVKFANMSKSSLFRLFQQELGISPVEYIISIRIQKAKELLKKSISVKETSFSLGFNDVNYFVRLFKNRVGVTPGAYMLR